MIRDIKNPPKPQSVDPPADVLYMLAQLSELGLSFGLEDASEKPLSCVIETRTTEGDDRRGLSRAFMIEVAPLLFNVVPFYFREISGASIPWTDPAPGAPISEQPVAGFNNACAQFETWAMRTFAENAPTYR